MQFEFLPHLKSPKDLQSLSGSQLQQLTAEIREALCHVVSNRAAHFASNLGVVELCVALHLVFDFSKDRLIWDTGHQIYPHKLVTGRFQEFSTIRQKGGLMGYPNPAESDYDLFMTGHAGSSVSTVLGLKTGDDLLFDDDRKAVAVIGDGALPSGIVFEAMNNAAGLNKDLLVILNDNKMGICPRVGGLASYLDKARVAPFYNGLKRDISWLLNKVPVVGDPSRKRFGQFKEAVKAFLHGGMLFEEMGFRYIGPVDGHDLIGLRKTLELVKDVEGPVLLHVFTEKGHGFEPACEDPVKFHTPAPFKRDERQQRRHDQEKLRQPPIPILPAMRSTRHGAGRAGRGAHRGDVRTATNSEPHPRPISPTGSSIPASAKPMRSPLPAGWPSPACGRSSISTARSCSGASTRSSRKSPCRTCRSCSAWTGPACAVPTAPRITACSTTATCGSSRTWS